MSTKKKIKKFDPLSDQILNLTMVYLELNQCFCKKDIKIKEDRNVKMEIKDCGRVEEDENKMLIYA